ncbi:hypothetical protein [Maribacter sp. HTCC2170]|uniref:hypothetical protein n=1 Tax=Maribacter sp. (strain HTCC2170 / KCCM 42371) TaxID=313603 RepID=UPI00006BD447|nr:hypothetical protein [Maribacter sp. HTCC2170]EAR02030.1 hypothetical protein FB2170_02065 [Maribacter sp. HTCC2170]
MVKRSTLFIVEIIILAGFGIGIYLQDLKHKESTSAYWKANRHNMGRLQNIQKFTSQINSRNWKAMRDSIHHQMDTLVILRFRKEVDSLNNTRKTPQQ